MRRLSRLRRRYLAAAASERDRHIKLVYRKPSFLQDSMRQHVCDGMLVVAMGRSEASANCHLEQCVMVRDRVLDLRGA